MYVIPDSPLSDLFREGKLSAQETIFGVSAWSFAHQFLNTFHLNPKFKADIFVPCGGRPASINIGNLREYVDERGRPRFKVIVEGANLFITQDARLRLEEKGVILYKDASAEFEVIWRENARKGVPRSVLTDLVSEKINLIKDSVAASGLAEDEALFTRTLEGCIPAALVDLVGFDKILERVPKAYLRALFASSLAGRYVYKYGLDANEVTFYEFLKEI